MSGSPRCSGIDSHTWNEVIDTPLFQLDPPLLELKAEMLDVEPNAPVLRKGTTTVPFGCTRGCPPRPVALSAVACPALHVFPPSLDVLICTRSPLDAISHST